MTLLDRLFPSLDSLMKAPVAEDGNAIMQLTAIEYGKQGSGKTQTTKWIVEEARKRYPDVSATWARGDLRLLLKGGFEPVPVNILIGEDMTNYPFGQWEKWAFFNVRHLMQKATSLSKGLCLIVMNVHDVHRIPKEFRMDVDAHILKNAPTNDWDERFYRKKIAKDHQEGDINCKCNLCWLKANEESWVEDPSLKRYGVWYAQRSIGRFEAGWIPHRNMTELTWKGTTHDPLQMIPSRKPFEKLSL